MKTTLLLILLTIAPFVQSQNYLQSGSQWRIDGVGLSMVNPCYYTERFVCEITGDSLVLGQTYKKIFHHGIKMEGPTMPNPNSNCASPQTFNKLYALIRQEGLRLYIFNGSEDQLLYDFDLQVGDTLPLSFNNFANDITVDSINTLQVGNETRKVFYLSQQTEVTMIIEGIGHNWGLIGTMQPFEFYETELECYAINDTAYYPSLGAPCELNVGLEELEATVALNAYPNPTNEKILIETGSLSTVQTLHLVDLYGVNCLVENDYQLVDGGISLDLTKLATGIYVVQIMDSNGKIGLVRVVKQ